MVLTQLAIPIEVFGVLFAIFWAVFLFWRAARIDLYSNEEIFDVLMVGSIAGLLGGRLGAYLLDFEKFKFSFEKLIFFHIYPGFNFYGFIVGALLAVSILVKRRRQNPWKFFDMAASPLIFGLTIFSGFTWLSFYFGTGKVDYVLLFKTIALFISFFVIKRLETLKRKVGFFACFYLVWVSTIDILAFITSAGIHNFKAIDFYPFTVSLAFLVFGCLLWYRAGRRILKNDAKRVFAFFLLKFLAAVRIIRSIDEAGKFSRSLILVPFTISRRFLVLLRGLLVEIKLGFLDFFHTLGLKR